MYGKDSDMKSLGIIIYGDLEFPDVRGLLDLARREYHIDFNDYEVVVRQVDLESRQKYGQWHDEEIYDYLTHLSPNIYNLYFEKTNVKSEGIQRNELLDYLIENDGMVIVLLNGPEEDLIPLEERAKINTIANLKLSAIVRV
jgi:hypothetical protein